MRPSNISADEEIWPNVRRPVFRTLLGDASSAIGHVNANSLRGRVVVLKGQTFASHEIINARKHKFAWIFERKTIFLERATFKIKSFCYTI